MPRKTSTAKVGLFVFLGIVILVLAIFFIGKRQELFASTFTVKGYFTDVQGLRSGASVRLGGIDVGSVTEVAIDSSGRIKVVMEIVDDVHQFIRTDTKATIQTEGLVGNKVVVLEVGSASAELIKDGGTIKTQEPLGISAVIRETQGVIQFTKEMTKNLAEITERINRGEGTIGKLLVDDDLYKQAVDLTSSADSSLRSITEQFNRLTVVFNKLGAGIEGVVGRIDKVVVDLDTIVTGVKHGKGVMGALLVDKTGFDSVVTEILTNIREATQEAELASSRLAENMEALKHNWLFKGYFEERGYWDKAEYEDEINSMLEELKQKIKLLNDKIETLQSLENQYKVKEKGKRKK